MSVTALVRVFGSHPPPGSLHLSFGWLLPSHLPVSAFVSGIVLMLFIYWGWDTALSVNEETADKSRTPGRAGIISTVLLLVTYVIVIISVQAFAGIGTKGVGLMNPAYQFDVLSVTGGAIFGYLRARHRPVPAADPHGAQLGGRLDPDHDPADRPHDAVDGGLRGARPSRSPRSTRGS